MLTFFGLSGFSAITCAMIAKVCDIGALKKTAAVLLCLLSLQIVTTLYWRRFWLNLADSTGNPETPKKGEAPKGTPPNTV